MDTQISNIAVVGDGAWGTAISTVLESAGHRVEIWGHDPDYLAEMRETRQNRLFLPGIEIPRAIGFEPDLPAALARADLVVVAVPSKFLRPVLDRAEGAMPRETPVLSLTKGLDAESLERPSQCIKERLNALHVAALSGPSHAEEVARGLPASVVAASDELEWARKIQHIVSTPRFRVYASGDIVGAEIAGAVKNVIALAAGVVSGMGLGDNALAALATRGLVEMRRLGVALGADEATFSGLAGMGDLITTCISEHSRNRRVGGLLAKGVPLDEILAGMNGVPESVTTTSLCLKLARKHDIVMPITAQVAAIMWEGKSPTQALDDLMTRARKDEL